MTGRMNCQSYTKSSDAYGLKHNLQHNNYRDINHRLRNKIITAKKNTATCKTFAQMYAKIPQYSPAGGRCPNIV